MNHTEIAQAQTSAIDPPAPATQYITGVELTASVLMITTALFTWLRAEFNSKKESAEAEASIIKLLKQELAEKDEEIDKTRIRTWQLEKEIRSLRQALEFSGEFSNEPVQKN